MSAELSSPSNGAPMGPIGPQLIILVSRVKGQLGPHSVKYLLRYQKVPEIWYLRRIRHMAVQGGDRRYMVAMDAYKKSVASATEPEQLQRSAFRLGFS